MSDIPADVVITGRGIGISAPELRSFKSKAPPDLSSEWRWFSLVFQYRLRDNAHFGHDEFKRRGKSVCRPIKVKF